MKYEKVKAAVIGCGMISDIYLKNLTTRFSIIEVTGVADLADEKASAQAEKYGVKKRTVRDIMDDHETELVINLTYPSSHYEITEAALKKGKHVYSEKCMAVTADEARSLYALAEKHNLRLAVAPDTFLGGSWQSARKFLDSGIIGSPIAFSAVLIRGYHMIKNDEDDRKRKFSVMYPGGGIPYDMGGYYLYNLVNLFGPVKRVCGNSFTRNKIRPYLNPNNARFNDDFTVETPNTLAATLEFSNGVIGNLLITSELFGNETTFEVYGDEGILYLGDPNNFGDTIYVKTRGGEKTPLPFTHPYLTDSRGLGAAELAWSMRTGRKQRVSPEMGLAAMEILAAAEKSGKDGKFVNITTACERPEPLSSLYYGGECDERILSL